MAPSATIGIRSAASPNEGAAIRTATPAPRPVTTVSPIRIRISKVKTRALYSARPRSCFPAVPIGLLFSGNHPSRKPDAKYDGIMAMRDATWNRPTAVAGAISASSRIETLLWMRRAMMIGTIDIPALMMRGTSSRRGRKKKRCREQNIEMSVASIVPAAVDTSTPSMPNPDVSATMVPLTTKRGRSAWNRHQTIGRYSTRQTWCSIRQKPPDQAETVIKRTAPVHDVEPRKTSATIGASSATGAHQSVHDTMMSRRPEPSSRCFSVTDSSIFSGSRSSGAAPSSPKPSPSPSPSPSSSDAR